MNGQVSSIEKAAFRMAFEYYARHCDPPANQETDAYSWWCDANNDAAPLYDEWKKCELGQELLLAVHGYIEKKAKAKSA